MTSPSTHSALEHFVYNLQMLAVGETTADHQHSGVFHRFNDQFDTGIQEAAPARQSASGEGLEGIGVELDLKIPRSETFQAVNSSSISRTNQNNCIHLN